MCNVHVVDIDSCPWHADDCQGQREKDHNDRGTAAKAQHSHQESGWEQLPLGGNEKCFITGHASVLERLGGR